VQIQFSGMRPGEKLYEEVFFDERSAIPSNHPKILYSRDTAPVAAFTSKLAGLINAAEVGSPPESLLRSLQLLVPDFQHATFHPPAYSVESPSRKLDMGDADAITVTGERQIVK
jgi:FlaA1/EpsC-like NDP-sugar epimerase